MQIMKFIRGALVVLALTVGAIQCAHSADQLPTVDNTANMLVLLLEDSVEGYVFVSKTGQTLAISDVECGKSTKCEALVLALMKAQNFTVLHIPASDCPVAKPPGVAL